MTHVATLAETLGKPLTANVVRMFRNWPETKESQASYAAARAELDHLLSEEKK